MPEQPGSWWDHGHQGRRQVQRQGWRVLPISPLATRVPCAPTLANTGVLPEGFPWCLAHSARVLSPGTLSDG